MAELETDLDAARSEARSFGSMAASKERDSHRRLEGLQDELEHANEQVATLERLLRERSSALNEAKSKVGPRGVPGNGVRPFAPCSVSLTVPWFTRVTPDQQPESACLSCFKISDHPDQVHMCLVSILQASALLTDKEEADHAIKELSSKEAKMAEDKQVGMNFMVWPIGSAISWHVTCLASHKCPLLSLTVVVAGVIK